MYPPAGTQPQVLFVPLNVHRAAFASSSSRTSTGRKVLRTLDPGAARSTEVAPQFEKLDNPSALVLEATHTTLACG